MASAVDLVLDNFCWRIKSIIPTDVKTFRKGFTWNDSNRCSPDQGSGMTRSFSVFYLGSDTDIEPTDATERTAWHLFQLEVAYSTDYALMALQKMAGQDRHLLNKQLRDDRLWVGTSASDPTSDIGLWDRVRVRDEMDRSSEITWYLTQQYRCMLRESEV